MGIDPGPHIFITIITLFLSGIFSLLKTSYEDLNKYKIENLLEEEKITEKEEKILLSFLDNLNEIQTAFLISDYMSNAFFATSLGLIGFHYQKLPGTILAVVVATILILICGESLPYFIAKARGDDVAIKFIGFTKLYSKILVPLTTITKCSSKWLYSLFESKDDSEPPRITEDQLYNIVNLSKDEGLLDTNEYGMIEKVFSFSDKYVKDVMTPRTDVVAVDINTDIEDIIEVFRQEGYSRVPIYENEVDNILGILHVKDLLSLFYQKSKDSIRKSLKKPIYSFEYQKSSDLFSQMRINNSTMAIVLDEYGGVDGIVTMEDLIEEIVGEIDDEYDDDADNQDIIVLKNNTYILDGVTRLEDIHEQIGLDLESEEVDTIGGFIFEKFDRIPKQAEVLKYENLEFTILKIEKNRISKIKMTIK